MVEFTLLPAVQMLRLVALPVFGWVAYRDYQTRRVPRRLWVPLYLLGSVIAVMLGITGITTTLLTGQPLPPPTVYFYLSVGVMLTIAVVFTRTGLLGRADGHALVVLGMLFPTRTAVRVGVAGVPLLGSVLLPAGGAEEAVVLPVLLPPVGVPLSLVILQLGAYIGAVIIGWVAWRNVRSGALTLAALRAQPSLLFQALTARHVPWDSLLETDGWVLTDATPAAAVDADAAATATTMAAGSPPPDTDAADDAVGAGDDLGEAGAPTAEAAAGTDALPEMSGQTGLDGFDLDVLRMYCRWRGVPLATLRADPAFYRDPATLPADLNPPTDGRVDPALDPEPPGGDPGGGADPEPASDGLAGNDDDRLRSNGGPPGHDPHPDHAGTPAEGTAGAPLSENDADADGADGDTAGGTPLATDTDAGPAGERGTGRAADGPGDPWGAAAFVADVDETYGMSAAELRIGLDHVTAPETDAYWVSVGLPFLVPLTIGLVVAVTVGSPF